MHNCYTVRGKSGAVTAFNKLDENYLRTVATVTDWAKYVVLCDENGNSVAKPANLQFVNADPSRGGDMRAVYTATLNVTPNTRFTEVALATDADIGSAVSSADISYLAEDEIVEVTAAVFLSAGYDEYTALCGGNNPLVRSILGCGPNATNYYMGGGVLAYPPFHNVPTADMIQSKVRMRFTNAGGELSLVCTAPPNGSEVFAICGDTPVIRSLRPYSRDTYMFSDYVDDHCAALLSGEHVDSILSVRVDGNYIANPEITRCYERIVKITDDEAVNLGVEGDVKSDPSGEYLLITTASYAEVYRIKGCNVERLLRVRRQYEQADITLGGSLCMWDTNSLTVYERNSGDEYVSASYVVRRGDDCMVFREGLSYHAVTIDGDYVVRYKISGGNVTVAENCKINGKSCFLSKCGNIAIWVDGSIYAKTLGANLSDEFACNYFSPSYTYLIQKVGNGFALVYEVETKSYYEYDFIHNTRTKATADLTCNGNLIYNRSGYYIFDFYNGSRRIRSDITTQGVQSACIAGDMLWVIKDNKLYRYYLYGTDVTVRMSRSDIGKQYYCSTRVRKLKGGSKPARFSVKFR